MVEQEKLSFLCPPQVRAMLTAVADKEERSRSAVIRRALDQYFRANGYLKEGE